MELNDTYKTLFVARQLAYAVTEQAYYLDIQTQYGRFRFFYGLDSPANSERRDRDYERIDQLLCDLHDGKIYPFEASLKTRGIPVADLLMADSDRHSLQLAALLRGHEITVGDLVYLHRDGHLLILMTGKGRLELDCFYGAEPYHDGHDAGQQEYDYNAIKRIFYTYAD